MIIGSRPRIVLTIVAALLIGLWLGRHQWLQSTAHWLNVSTPPQSADYLFVLNGDVNTRPFIGAAIAKAGLASEVLLVPVRDSGSQDPHAPPTSHEQARRVLMHQGVPESQIRIIPGQCASTFDEAHALADFLQQDADPEATVAVVTSRFHTRRTRWIYQQVFGDQADRLSFVGTPTDGFDESNWWRVEDGFMTYGTEYLKLAFYYFRYGSGLWFTGALVGVVMIAWAACKRLPTRTLAHA